MRRRVLALGAALFVAGCGGGAEGSPVAEEQAPVFEPCSIPADAIEATGLQTTTVDEGWSDGIEVDDWTRCVWESTDTRSSYFFRMLFSARHNLDDIRNNPVYTEMSDIRVGDHTWLQYKFNSTARATRCNVAFGTTEGVAIAVVRLISQDTPGVDPCALVLHHAEDLSAYFPSQK